MGGMIPDKGKEKYFLKRKIFMNGGKALNEKF
jgi:hypothetical protein